MFSSFYIIFNVNYILTIFFFNFLYNTIYFSYCFKKYYGVSPARMRRGEGSE